MKYVILILGLLSTLFTVAQTKNCEIDYIVKNDSTDLKKTKDYLIVERIYPQSLESVYISLLKSDDLTYLQLQYLQKDTQFISTTCVDQKSMVSVQLSNGNIINFRHANIDYCNNLSFDSEQNANIRILSTYFLIQKEDLERLKESTATVMRIRYATTTATYELLDKIESKVVDKSYYPSNYFINNIPCIE
ncbi:hypothetical protein [Flavobacterium sp. NKUCC04_CG]|uniref:hypothetical protein n=1 Tax=Flavobacterium sp. NKUCC04_CG TaxID=2842121 RepID=UPI001C5B89F1|nr:hypothetical protein [Flavobacterium sp. NKUCC04_CG]MBW3517977.1 hypothetical protein [Flavobacterium sp. NKUCC04_CG]